MVSRLLHTILINYLIAYLNISDYNNDHFITTYDIEQATAALTRNELGPEEIAVVCDKVLEEANNDDDGKISLPEFQAAVSRSPDFLRYVSCLTANET